jgi:sulfotransferase family protein
LLAGYEEFDAFTDMECLDEFGTTCLEGYKLYPHLPAQYPNAVFILNTRNREDWIRSRLVHGKKISYAKRAMAFYGAASIDNWPNDGARSGRTIIVVSLSSLLANLIASSFAQLRLTFLTSSTTCFRNAGSILSIIGWKLKRRGDNTYSPTTYPLTEMRVSQVRFMNRTVLLIAQAGSPTEQDCARYWVVLG